MLIYPFEDESPFRWIGRNISITVEIKFIYFSLIKINFFIIATNGAEV